MPSHPKAISAFKPDDGVGTPNPRPTSQVSPKNSIAIKGDDDKGVIKKREK